ncbi:metallophosphoesterase [Novosphingobium pentaromativorans]|uniref:Calcineurin-like phosphoesterase domain-containing protein n=1 Tax=Novosphingobium pentaromativorans US6-1 TaxID=1088721 RepID=G6EGT5_9SPHN|nr:metallophosphoesterase [Novosphingobium pentaromativorans]AIT82067.1 hypothetical protein JI59_21230 [Novosphingobium pentaromativorans US6-1]EHJ59480.1 hypothetical protein NSU_3556 [Novosphingobium pentaromativorans US6-1]
MDILVIMPFGEHQYVRDEAIASTDFDIIYHEIIAKAVSETGNIAVRADEIIGAGDVTTQLMDRIVSSPVMIADLSMPNGNVYFELGVRQAVSNHRTIIMALEGTILPFNVRNRRVLFYQAGDAVERAESATRLARWIEQVAATAYASPVQLHLKALGLAADPDDAESFERDLRGKIDRATTLEQLNAVWSWAKAVPAPPPFALLELADKFARLKAWKTAASIARVARDARPGDYEIHRLLGWYLRNDGEEGYEEAEASFREALRLNGGDLEALGMLGGLLKRQGRYTEAAECYAKGVGEAPDNLYLRVAHAGMLLMSGPSANGQALALYAKLAEDCGDEDAVSDEWANAVAGEAEFVLGNNARALERYRTAHRLANSPTVLASPADQLRQFASVGFRASEALDLAAQLDQWSSEIAVRSGTAAGPASGVSGTRSELPVIIHLSDPHFGYKVIDGKNVDMHRFRDGDYSTTLEAHMLDEFVSRNRPFTFDPGRLFVVISGDIVYRGVEEEFQEALSFCTAMADKLRIPRERFVFCPGNHDVSWADAQIARGRRFDNYLNFLLQFYGETLFRTLYPLVTWDFRVGTPRPEPHEIIGMHRFGGQGISFVSLNSCVYETDQNHYGLSAANR